MIEALKVVKPWQQPSLYVKYLTSLNLMMPYLDVIFTLCFIPGVVLAFFGNYMLAGPLTLLVLPVALIQNYILYSYQKKVFKGLELKVRRNVLGLFVYIISDAYESNGYYRVYTRVCRTTKNLEIAKIEHENVEGIR